MLISVVVAEKTTTLRLPLVGICCTTVVGLELFGFEYTNTEIVAPADNDNPLEVNNVLMSLTVSTTS